MPYPGEHAARQNSPDKYKKFRRENNKFGAGIDVIWGITEDGKTEIQSIRFDSKKYSKEQAMAWLKEHKMKSSVLEKWDLDRVVKSMLGIEESSFSEEPELKKQVSILSKAEDKQLVTGVVWEPGIEDSQGDITSEEVIEKAAHEYMREHRKMRVGHEEDCDSVPVESWIAPIDMEMEGHEIKKGTWMMTSYIASPTLWKAIKEGKINSYSPGGSCVREVRN